MISVYPNPANDFITVKLNKLSNAVVVIYDLTGKIVLQTTALLQPINIEKLANGTYIISITDSNNKNYAQKFIKE